MLIINHTQFSIGYLSVIGIFSDGPDHYILHIKDGNCKLLLKKVKKYLSSLDIHPWEEKFMSIKWRIPNSIPYCVYSGKYR